MQLCARLPKTPQRVPSHHCVPVLKPTPAFEGYEEALMPRSSSNSRARNSTRINASFCFSPQIESPFFVFLAMFFLGVSAIIGCVFHRFPHPYTSHASCQNWSQSTSTRSIPILRMKWNSFRCNDTPRCVRNLPCLCQCCSSADRHLSLAQLTVPMHTTGTSCAHLSLVGCPSHDQ